MTKLATMSATAGHGLLPSLPLDRRGRLRNGAHPGDFLAAPRCGARTRCGGACRQPAMANGRCRLHGGLSTGPRTPEGRARCARARTIHGGYSAEVRALQAEARFHIQRMRTLRLRLTAGHGVLRKDPAGAAPRGRPVGSAASQGRPCLSPRKRGSAAPAMPSTAGHGVLPSRPSFMQRTLLGCTALGVSLRPAAVTAGHGVLPSVSARIG